MIKNKTKKSKKSNGVFKTIVRKVVREELQDVKRDFSYELQEVEKRLGGKIKNLPTKDEFFTTMDKVMGELQTTREEFIAHQGQHYEINERLDKLEASA